MSQETRTIQKFQNHLLNFEELKGSAPLLRNATDLVARNTQNLMSVKQFKLAFEEFDFKNHEDIKEMQRKRSRSCPQTQIVEDLNNVMKNRKRKRLGATERGPEAAMGVAIESGVVERLHR